VQVNKDSTVMPKVGGIFKFHGKSYGHFPEDYFVYKILKIEDNLVLFTIKDCHNRNLIGSEETRRRTTFWQGWNYDDFIVTYDPGEFEKHKQRMLNV
jgi:hypothetical protein